MRLSRTFRFAALLIATCVLLPGAAQAATQTVVVKNLSFGAQPTTINVGDSVTWTNQDPVAHTVTANNAAFDKPLPANGTVTIAFAVAGSYAYHCSIHTFMTGTIVVAGPTPAPSTPRPTPPPTAPPTVPPTAPPTAQPTAVPTAVPTASPSAVATPSPSPSPSATPTPAPSATGTPIAVPSGVALASPTVGPGPDLGSGPGPVIAGGAVILALVLGGAALYLYRRR